MARQPQTALERTGGGVDGRVAFCCFALAAGLAVLALLERMGVAAGVVRALLIFGVISGMVAIAALQRTMRISHFYAGGRTLPAAYAGLALLGLLAALAAPLLPAAAAGLPRPTLGTGLLLGGIGAGLLSGPLLRKTGAFSVPDLLAARFPSLPLRLAVVAVAALIAGLVGLAAFEAAVEPVLRLVATNRPLGAALVAALLALTVVPGGLGGTVWMAAASAIVLFAALGLSVLEPTGTAPAPWAAAAQGLAQWEAIPWLLPALDPLLVVALAVGVGVLVPLLGPAIASRSTGEAQRGGRRALLLGLLLIALAAALAGGGGADRGIVLPTLTLTAEMAVELALAAAAVQALAATLGHDGVYRLRDAVALTSQRLAITRGVVILALAAMALRIGAAPVDPVPLIGVALWLSAALLAPLLILALWARAAARDAAMTLVTAGGAATAALLAGPPPLSAERLALSALVACGFGLLAGLVTSLRRRAGTPAGADFVRSVLRDPAEFPQLDRGA